MISLGHKAKVRSFENRRENHRAMKGWKWMSFGVIWRQLHTNH